MTDEQVPPLPDPEDDDVVLAPHILSANELDETFGKVADKYIGVTFTLEEAVCHFVLFTSILNEFKLTDEAFGKLIRHGQRQRLHLSQVSAEEAEAVGTFVTGPKPPDPKKAN